MTDPAIEAIAEQQREVIGEKVSDRLAPQPGRGYLIEHPEVIEEAMGVLRERRELERRAPARAAIAQNGEALLAHPMSPVSGDAHGDVTVVEFFDYQCPYCKRALGPVTERLAADERVRVVWKEFPILGPVSYFAARAATQVPARNASVEALTGAHDTGHRETPGEENRRGR